MEPTKNPTEKTQECPLQITDSSYFDILTEQRQNPSLVVQQLFSEVLSSEQTQAENERLRIQHQKRIGAANQFLRKQELQRNQLLQQKKQCDPEIQNDDFIPEYFPLTPLTSQKTPPQQVARSEFSNRNTFIFHVITERQKRAFTTDAVSFTENHI